MSVKLAAVVEEANNYLDSYKFNDFAPNGLQVEGYSEIKRIISGVSASQELLDAAIQIKADLIIVHHGYFWKNENPCITGMKKRRLQTLLESNISLLAYHLPLDLHPEVGNNVQLARKLAINIEGDLYSETSQKVGLIGYLDTTMHAFSFAELVETQLKRKPLIVESEKIIRKIGLCTGSGQRYIDQAIMQGVDLYLTGEASEQTFHIAKENNVSFIAAGHHATERYGIQALGNYLAKIFSIEHIFIDCENPI